MHKSGDRPLKIAVLVKQIPRTDQFSLSIDGYLKRESVPTELNPYCRRALALGVSLAKQTGGECHAYSLGPESARNVLVESLAAGATRGILISDPVFAGSDSFATTKTIYSAIMLEGAYDLVLTGLNSVDADTGQVPPQLAELLGWPFLSGAREVDFLASPPTAWLEQDDRGISLEFSLPCVVSTAERACDPAKPSREAINMISGDAVELLDASVLGGGPWGQALSLTRVSGFARVHHRKRCHLRLDGNDPLGINQAVAHLADWGAFDTKHEKNTLFSADSLEKSSLSFVILCEPGEVTAIQGLCARAKQLNSDSILVLTDSADVIASDRLPVSHRVLMESVAQPEQAAKAIGDWLDTRFPNGAAVLGPSSQWGRHVLSRLAMAKSCGLTADAVDLGLSPDGKQVLTTKPSFCGKLMVNIEMEGKYQMATMREGLFYDLLETRDHQASPLESLDAARFFDSRIHITAKQRLDIPFNPIEFNTLIGVGQGVAPEDYDQLDELKSLLAGEFVATRKVTDYGWLPRARQVGLTGKSIAPHLYLAIGLSGRPYHSIGIEQSRWIVALNNDPYAPICDQADITLLGDWRDTVPMLVAELRKRAIGCN